MDAHSEAHRAWEPRTFGLLQVALDLFKMVTFMDKTTSGRRYLHIQPSKNDADGEETKLPIHSSITSICKCNCTRAFQPCFTDKTSLLSSHSKAEENPSSCQLLHHDIESGLKSWVRLPFQGILLSISLGYHYHNVFMMKSFLLNENSLATFIQVVLICLLLTKNLCKVAMAS
ncbi:hypothetical protein Cgig2_017087 [Carnegiea gigantea]|uniref:Uncharacterized protein n=1 Tax=Carnegiea gigantea TaxID=171969 RepID=A0A9Q1K422_9CARY|nr:hypothetical protein Cgig2_017087 [Carnegiea gigantea]